LLGKIIMLQFDYIFHRSMIALNLTLGLGMIGATSDGKHPVNYIFPWNKKEPSFEF